MNILPKLIIFNFKSKLFLFFRKGHARKRSMLFVFLLLSGMIFGQEILTVEEAVTLALKNNFDVELAQKNIQKAKLNTDKRNTGLLPTVTANAGANYSIGTFWGKSVNASDYKMIKGAGTQNYNASIGANYLLYDGNFRKYNWDKLKLFYHLSEIEAQALYERTALNVHNTYYQIAKLKEILALLQSTMEVSKHRLERAQVGVEFGKQSKLAVLNAQVDVNNDSLNIQNTKLQITNAKRNLNALLRRDLSTDFDVITEVAYLADLTEDQLIQDAIERNTQIKAINQNINLSDLDIKMAQAGYKPTVRLSANYGGTFADQPAGFFDKQITLGLGAGVQVSWNIFDASRKIKEQNAIIAKETNLLQKQKIEYELESQVRTDWANYQNALSTLKFQQVNIQTAQSNFDRTKERFGAGQISSVEFRQAQLGLLRAQSVYQQAKFDAKVAELRLLLVSGRLVE